MSDYYKTIVQMKNEIEWLGELKSDIVTYHQTYDIDIDKMINQYEYMIKKYEEKIVNDKKAR